MKFKLGVSINGIRPELILGVMVVAREFERRNLDVVITSGTDGTHSRTSLHYAGQAVDFRTRHATQQQIDEIVTEVNEAIGEHFDCIAEQTHIHLEYQPTRGIG